MSDMVRWKNGKLTLALRDSKGFEVGKIEGEEGTSARAVKAVITAKVSAALAKAGGLTAAQQKALLETITVNFKVLSQTGRDSHPYQDLKLTTMRRLQAVLMESQVTGYGAASGLGKPLVQGTNFVTWESLLPLGHIEHVDESELLGGMGAAQLRTSEITFKTEGEPLKALDADLELIDFTVELYPDARETPHRAIRWAVVPHVDIIRDSDKQEITTQPGLVLGVYDRRPLAGSQYGAIRVTVGGLRVTDDPSTPADVEAYFEKQPDSGAIEASITDEVTPLYRVPDVAFNELLPGRVSVRQIVKQTNFDVEVLRLPVPTEEQVFTALMKLLERMPAGTTLHAVNAATIHGLELKDSLLPFVGWYAFTSDQAPYHLCPGLRATLSPEAGRRTIEVWVPPVQLAQAAQEYAAHVSLGDQASADAVVRRVSADIPAAIISDAGFKGGVGSVVRDVQLAITTVTAALARAGQARAGQTPAPQAEQARAKR